MADRQKTPRVAWNKGKIVGQKAPLKLREIWAIRVRLQLRNNLRDLALFNLAIDSKLRVCDLLALRVGEANHVNSRAVVMQRKTRRPVQFEITEITRDALQAWTRCAGLRSSDYVFRSRSGRSPHLSTRQYARIVPAGFVTSAWMDPAMAPIRCVERKRLWSTGEPGISGLCSSCSVTRSLRAPSGTSESR